MAAGDVHIMASYLSSGSNLWASDTIKCALVSSSTTPSKSDSNACWGAGGAQNYSTNECASGGNYVGGGFSLTGNTIVGSGGVQALNTTSPVSWAANASNPTNARWGIFYDNTLANKNVVGYVDLGALTSLVPGLQINLDGLASGVVPLFTLTAS